jgi:hypothetical protein
MDTVIRVTKRYYAIVVVSLREIIRSLRVGEVDGMIESASVRRIK